MDRYVTVAVKREVRKEIRRRANEENKTMAKLIEELVYAKELLCDREQERR